MVYSTETDSVTTPKVQEIVQAYIDEKFEVHRSKPEKHYRISVIATTVTARLRISGALRQGNCRRKVVVGKHAKDC